MSFSSTSCTGVARLRRPAQHSALRLLQVCMALIMTKCYKLYIIRGLYYDVVQACMFLSVEPARADRQCPSG